MRIEDLGLSRLINAVGPSTRYGGVHLDDRVLAAMAAANVPIRIDELQAAAGRRIAELTGAPGAYVTSGAAAGLFIASCIALTRGDVARAHRLPSLPGAVVVPASHSDPYDRIIGFTGAQVVTAGYPTTTTAAEVGQALQDFDGVALLLRPERGRLVPDLQTCVRAAKDGGAMVIIDGALTVPPFSRLGEMFDMGADLVATSGGKSLRGPQGTGILFGTPGLVEQSALHHQDLDVRHDTWIQHDLTGGLLEPLRGSGPLRHGGARAMKVTANDIMGLLTALEIYVDEGAPETPLDELKALTTCLTGVELDGVVLHEGYDPDLGIPVLDLHLRSPQATAAMSRDLGSWAPPIVIGESDTRPCVLTVNPMALHPGDGTVIGTAIAQLAQKAEPCRTE